MEARRNGRRYIYEFEPQRMLKPTPTIHQLMVILEFIIYYSTNKLYGKCIFTHESHKLH